MPDRQRGEQVFQSHGGAHGSGRSRLALHPAQAVVVQPRAALLRGRAAGRGWLLRARFATRGCARRASAAVRVTTLSSQREQRELSASPRKPKLDSDARSANELSCEGEGQRSPPRAQRAHAAWRGAETRLGGVILGGEGGVVLGRHARAVVRHLHRLRAVLLQPHLHHRGARVQRVLYQLLHRARQVQHHLAGADAVHVALRERHDARPLHGGRGEWCAVFIR